MIITVMMRLDWNQVEEHMLCERSGEAEGTRCSNNGMTSFDTKSNYLLGLFFSSTIDVVLLSLQ